MKGALFLFLLALSGNASAEPLIVDNGRLFITARINGVQTEALLDSGAEATLVDPVLAREAKFGPGKPVRMEPGRVECGHADPEIFRRDC